MLSGRFDHIYRYIWCSYSCKLLFFFKRLLPTFTFPASLTAAMILACSGIWPRDTVDMTTSTCLIALIKLSWSWRSPCTYTPHSYLERWNYILAWKLNRLINTTSLTYSTLTPKFLNISISFPLTGSEAVLSLTKAKVGCPAFTLASTIYFPMYPVPPMIKVAAIIRLIFF